MTKGAIRAKWSTLNWERGTLGYPTTDERCGLARDGCFNHFENNGSIHYSPATGAHMTKGAIRTAWAGEGWERSPWGYPTEDPKHPGGSAPSNHRVQIFENGFFYFDGTYVTGEWGGPACTNCRISIRVR